jgi:hypothetical protein
MRGNIRKRGKHSYQLKFDDGSVNGKRRTRWITVKGTYKDAQKELTRLLTAADEGTLPDPSNATLAEYLRAWCDAVPPCRQRRSNATANLVSCKSSLTLALPSCKS